MGGLIPWGSQPSLASSLNPIALLRYLHGSGWPGARQRVPGFTGTPVEGQVAAPGRGTATLPGPRNPVLLKRESHNANTVRMNFEKVTLGKSFLEPTSGRPLFPQGSRLPPWRLSPTVAQLFLAAQRDLPIHASASAHGRAGSPAPGKRPRIRPARLGAAQRAGRTSLSPGGR